MSDGPQGQGWWLASDGKWYPPQQPTPPQSPPQQPSQSPPQGYPTQGAPPQQPPGFPPSGPPPQQPPQQPPGYPTPGPAPGGFDPRATMAIPSDRPSNVLVIRANGQPRTFVPPATPVIGREPTCDVQVDNPRVSRHHARASFDGSQWVLEDLQSTTGVWVNGRRQPRVPLAGEMRVWLGPIGEGGELEITAPGSAPDSSGSRSNVALIVIGVIAVLALLTAGVILATSRRGTDVATTATTEVPKGVDINQAIRSTVLVDVGFGRGSGSIISEDGLILTNAHVAAPNALGQAIETKQPGKELEKPPKKISILTVKGQGEAAEKEYEAEVMAADGYLDLAVLQITKDKDGNDVDRKTLKLPTYKIGDSKTLEQASSISFIGFPGISDTKSITITKGTVSGFLEDNRLKDNRAWINTDTNIAGGNSGGAAIDEKGNLVGVPTISRFEKDRGEQISRARSIHFLGPVLDAAKQKRDNPDADDYVSPWVVKASGNERLGKASIAKPAKSEEDIFTVQDSCPSSGGADASSSDPAIAVAIEYSGFENGSEDVLVALTDGNGGIVGLTTNEKSYTTPLNGSGCFVVTVPIKVKFTGKPKVIVLAGGDYQEVKGE